MLRRFVHSTLPSWRLLFILSSFSAFSASSDGMTALPVSVSERHALPIRVAVASWNLAETTPTVADCNFIKKFVDDDLVILGVQECEDLRPRSKEGSRSLAWGVLQKYALGPEFKRLKKLRMGGIQMSVFAKRHIAGEVSNVRCVCVPCGIGNIMVNKGAVCTVLTVRNATIAAVNVHLAAHEAALSRRNADYRRIQDRVSARLGPAAPTKSTPPPVIRLHTSLSRKKTPFRRTSGLRRVRHGAVRGASAGRSPTSELARGLAQSMLNMDRSTLDLTIDDAYGLSAQLKGRGRGSAPLDAADRKWPFDVTFFFGDLNYRIQYPRGSKALRLRRELEELAASAARAARRGQPLTNDTATIQSRVVDELLRYDQLRKEMRKRKPQVLAGFEEMRISFLPTYKYDRGSHRFDSSAKRRKPSYTDRILFSVAGPRNALLDRNSSVQVTPLQYTSEANCLHGDHRPVCARFRVTMPLS